MPLARAFEALRESLGPEAVREHAPLAFEGCKLVLTLAPADGEALARCVRTLHDGGLAALVRGGGSRLATGNLLRDAQVLLSTEALTGVEELDADEGVLRARAGTPLAALRESLAGSGWELPLDPAGTRTTLGGALAAAAVGPRHTGFGPPRDAVLGLDVVLGDGVRTRCGGRVVKNVTGYDLAKLHVGAFGSLGVIEAAWMRLRPAPARTALLVASLGEDEQALPAALVAARMAGVRVAALVDAALLGDLAPAPPDDAGLQLVVELAGDAPVVDGSARRLATRTGAHPAGPEALERVRGLQAVSPDADALHFRLSSLPTRLGKTVRALRDAHASLLVHPATGLVTARFAMGSGADEGRADAAWRAAQRAARAGGGDFVLEAAPAWVREGRDVFGAASSALPIMRALKARFDPKGVLNPGRFAGGL